jgi:hypothetical protein
MMTMSFHGISLSTARLVQALVTVDEGFVFHPSCTRSNRSEA